MKKDDKILWIYLHIHKCAGCTFGFHLTKNFSENQIFRAGYADYCTRSNIDISSESYKDYKKNYKDKIASSIGAISKIERKNKNYIWA